MAHNMKLKQKLSNTGIENIDSIHHFLSMRKNFSSITALKTKYRHFLLSLENNLIVCAIDVERRLYKRFI